METPFDTLLDRCWRIVLSRDPQKNTEFSELFKIVYSFTKIARLLHMDMVNASENIQQEPKFFTQDVHRENEDLLIRCRLSYFQFIDHVNRTGRVLKGMGFSVPLYARIYFFRNKVVEHWDDYIQFISSGDSLVLSKGKIAIPYAVSDKSFNNAGRVSLQQQIRDEFKNKKVTLASLEGKRYGEYADVIFTGLEQIDPELRYDKHERFGIPKPLVMLLFQYGFPTPISDMEEYCKTLAAWLGDLPLITT